MPFTFYCEIISAAVSISMSLTDKQLEEATYQLEQIVSNHFFRKHEARSLPTFDRTELAIGPRLGVGGFCVVSEIQDLKLDPEKEEDTNDNDDGGGETPPPQPQAAFGPNASNGDTYIGSFHCIDDDDLDSLTGLNNVGQHDHHYNLTPRAARNFMAEHALRDGDARYAIKKLRPDLDAKEKFRAVMDLAIEAKFLAVVSHPNIIKMRGTASTGPLRYDYFIVLDRLYCTLEDKIDDWSDQHKSFAGCCGCIGSDKNELASLMLERLVALYDISKAMAYLHENNIIYRDLKPDNIGSDVRGDNKLFDFGLAKVLSKKDKCKDGTYKLTGLTGSRRYMAPEVAMCKSYNLTADSFSFATLTWQVLSLHVPFESFTPGDYIRQVCEQGYRPSIPSSWPVFLRVLLKDSWKADTKERPDFVRICNVLKGEMGDLADSTRESIHQRTAHMMNRSRRSIRNLTRSIPVESLTEASG